MEYSIEPSRLKSAFDVVEALSRFSAFLHLHLSAHSLTIYTINTTLSSYARVTLSSSFFTKTTIVDPSSYSHSFKVSASTLLYLLKSKKLSNDLQLIFSTNHIVAVFKQLQFTEKIYKFPFEQVDFIDAGHADLMEYPFMVSILSKNLWQSIIPHTLITTRLNELAFNFTPEGLKLCSRDEASFLSITTTARKDFYEYSVKREYSFTLIKSEVVGLIMGAEKSESLIKVYFGLEASPIVLSVGGCGEGISMVCIMSAMVEDVPAPQPVEDMILESDSEEQTVDDFTIPGTPEYVYWASPGQRVNIRPR